MSSRFSHPSSMTPEPPFAPKPAHPIPPVIGLKHDVVAWIEGE